MKFILNPSNHSYMGIIRFRSEHEMDIFISAVAIVSVNFKDFCYDNMIELIFSHTPSNI